MPLTIPIVPDFKSVLIGGVDDRTYESQKVAFYIFETELAQYLNSLNITAIELVGTHIQKVVTVADNIPLLQNVYDEITTISVVASNILDVVAVGQNIGSVVNVSNNMQHIVQVVNNLSSINTVSLNITKVNTVADNIVPIVELHDKLTEVLAVHNKLTAIETVADNINAVITTSDNIQSVTDVANNISSVNTVAVNIDSVNTNTNNMEVIVTVADNIDNVNRVGNSIDNVNTVADNIDSVNTVANNIADVNTTASLDEEIDTLADIAQEIVDLDEHLKLLGYDGFHRIIGNLQLIEDFLKNVDLLRSINCKLGIYNAQNNFELKQEYLPVINGLFTLAKEPSGDLHVNLIEFTDSSENQIREMYKVTVDEIENVAYKQYLMPRIYKPHTKILVTYLTRTVSEEQVDECVKPAGFAYEKFGECFWGAGLSCIPQESRWGVDNFGQTSWSV